MQKRKDGDQSPETFEFWMYVQNHKLLFAFISNPKQQHSLQFILHKTITPVDHRFVFGEESSVKTHCVATKFRPKNSRIK